MGRLARGAEQQEARDQEGDGQRAGIRQREREAHGEPGAGYQGEQEDQQLAPLAHTGELSAQDAQTD
ncbi:hypothetical protein DMB38_00040 [Streptomyces sp. WAC 06738]|nr:hypothetical protein DMB38_00040 [Streptomyces sp. WAC 06738]